MQEKTDLEEQRHALAREVQAYRSKILQLEEDLLFRLSNSKVCVSLETSREKGRYLSCREKRAALF